MISVKRLCELWNSFWFAPESPVSVAVFRILFGLLVLQFGWFMSGELQWMLGPKAVVSQAANDVFNATPRINLFTWIPQSDAAVNLVWLGFIIAAACLTLGLFTRVSAVLVYLVLISCDARNSFIFTGADNMLRVLSFLLMFSQCGAMLSLDRLLAVWLTRKPRLGPPAPSSPWALRLIQVQIALCYWAAFSSKINGWTWVDGSAVFYVTHIIEENKYGIPFVYDHLWTCQLLSWFTLVIEFALAVLIWIKELRLPLILLGIPFHLALDYTLIIPQFQFVMIASLISFVEPSTYHKLMAMLRALSRRGSRAPLLVVYDGKSDLACRFAESIARLDLFQSVELVDADGGDERLAPETAGEIRGRSGLFVLSGSRAAGGVEALRAMARRLPLIVVLLPLLCLPGAGGLVEAFGAVLTRLYPDRSNDNAVAST